ncbi:MAG: hypothetical protein ACRC7N_07475 [Clostridium sp.]
MEIGKVSGFGNLDPMILVYLAPIAIIQLILIIISFRKMIISAEERLLNKPIWSIIIIGVTIIGPVLYLVYKGDYLNDRS